MYNFYTTVILGSARNKKSVHKNLCRNEYNTTLTISKSTCWTINSHFVHQITQYCRFPN